MYHFKVVLFQQLNLIVFGRQSHSMRSVTIEKNIFKTYKQTVNPLRLKFQTIYKSIMQTLISHLSYKRMEGSIMDGVLSAGCTGSKLMVQNLISADSTNVNTGFLL